jgi:hypothetical protein
MGIKHNSRLKPLQEFARAVGARITVEYIFPGEGYYTLVDGDGNPVTSDADIGGMLDSIEGYYGLHPCYADAREKFDYMTRGVAR